MARTEYEWAKYVEALQEDISTLRQDLKWAREAQAKSAADAKELHAELEDHMQAYDELREERDELAEQCAELAAENEALRAEAKELCSKTAKAVAEVARRAE